MTTMTGYLIQPTDDAALRTSFLEAMYEHEVIEGAPDADGLTMADLRGETCLTHYSRGLRDGTALRPGTEPMTPTVWWYVEGIGEDRTYLGRMSLRHRPATDLLGESGSQLWVSVRPSRRRQGLGRRLLTAACQFARAQGITTAVVEISGDNAGGRRLVETAGAQPIQHRTGCRRYVLPILETVIEG